MAQREYYQMRKRNGLCVECGEQDAYTLVGRSYCYECLQKAKARGKKYKNEHKKQKADYDYNRMKLLKKEHKCIFCYKQLPSDYNYFSCEICRAKRRIKVKERRKLRGVYEKVPGVICTRCNRNKVLEGKKLCADCYDWFVEHVIKKGHETCKMKRENQNPMWQMFYTFNPHPNLRLLEQSINDLIQMATQKTAGQNKVNAKKDAKRQKYANYHISWSENLEMTIQSIIMECCSLKKHGYLEEMQKIIDNYAPNESDLSNEVVDLTGSSDVQFLKPMFIKRQFTPNIENLSKLIDDLLCNHYDKLVAGQNIVTTNINRLNVPKKTQYYYNIFSEEKRCLESIKNGEPIEENYAIGQDYILMDICCEATALVKSVFWTKIIDNYENYGKRSKNDNKRNGETKN